MKFKKTFINITLSQINFYAQTIQALIQESPRFVLEMIIISIALVVSLYLFIFGELQIDNYLPILALYFLSAFKLIPYFQNIYSCLATIKGNIVSFYDIEKDLLSSKNIQESKINDTSKNIQSLKRVLVDQNRISVKY